MNMFKELERGSFGYTNKKKNRQLMQFFLFLGVGVLMFIVGLLLHNFDKANFITILAILMVLPMTKAFVIYVVLFPYKSVSKELYDEVSEKVSANAILMTDMVITSPDKPMGLSFVVISDTQVLCMLGKAKQDVAYIEKYLKESLANNKIEGFTVKVFDDYSKFLDIIGTRDYEKTSKQEECFKYIRTLVV